MENSIALKTIFNPDRDTAKAKRAADKLIDIVKQNKWSINVGGKSDHLMYEAWQTVGKYFNVTVATKESEPVEIGGVSGFKAIGYVVDNKTGIEVGHAEAYCMKDEKNWAGKPTFQLASMAQTRAGSKALRQMFGFVVALAGYSPTPAEEMTGEENTTVSTGEVLISEKQISFLQRLLKDKGYSTMQLEKKYKTKISELGRTQATSIIENLMKLPNAIAGEEAGLGQATEDEVGEDDVPVNL